jgi:hypothetical protein
MPRLETEVPATPPNRFGGLAEVLAMLERASAPCLVFGGWAEGLLELRAPGPHGDLDLVHLNDSFATIDLGFRRGRLPEEIRAKRFPHKRAFAWRGLCCEILLIQDWRARPASWFWGDIPLFWQAPIAHSRVVVRTGHRLNVVSAANLQHYWARHRDIQPWRWRAFPYDR